MTKPKDFALNTDYLALAQVGTAEFVAVFPSETFAGGSSYSRTQDFPIGANPGATDQIMVSCNEDEYTVGNSRIIQSTPRTLEVYAYRPNTSTIRINLHVYTGNDYTMPMQTIKIKVASFRPPNVF